MSAAAPPREQDGLVGQAAAERALLDAVQGGRLHHAWLLTGPPGIGKATLAFRFARWMLAGQPPGVGLGIGADHPVFRRVAAGTHADLLVVARSFDEKRQRLRGEIVVEEARRISDFLRLTPAEGGWRIVVLDGAEHLNRNAANALLKVLEEPPPRALLMLLSSAPGRLLPTLRSRCRTLRLEPLGPADMTLALRRLLPMQDEETRQALAELAQGAPGRALELAGEDGIALAGLVRDAMTPGFGGSRAYPLADAVLRREGGFFTFLTLLGDTISDQLRRQARGGSHPPAATSDHLAATWQEIRRLRDDTERLTLDKRQALLSSLSLLDGR